MSQSNSTQVSRGTGPGFLLFLVFLVLKLTGYITWSWWWVTAPLWIPLGLAALLFGIAGVILLISHRRDKRRSARRRLR